MRIERSIDWYDQSALAPETRTASAHFFSSLSTLGSNTLYTSGNQSEHMLVVTSETAHWLSELGWSKHDMQVYLFETARQPVREMRAVARKDGMPIRSTREFQ